jgi:hypothetical protein
MAYIKGAWSALKDKLLMRALSSWAAIKTDRNICVP